VFETDLHQALEESIADVLEKMFFVREAQGTSKKFGGEPEIAARLRFDGDPSGSLTLRTNQVAARSMAADFLGEDQTTLTEQQIEDVVCELANMICGSVLSRVDSRAIFRLATPRIILPEAPGLAAPEEEDSWHHAVEVGDGLLAVVIKTEKTAC